ncbi:MAG: hydroxylase [Bacteroidota bacterium]
MHVHYLEIVTDDVDATCALFAAVHGTAFGDPDPTLGGARTASVPGGGTVGVRAPMHDAEQTVTRPYVLVENIEAAVTAAEQAGASILVPPMEIPGHGQCAIYVQGNVEAGLWQV